MAPAGVAWAHVLMAAVLACMGSQRPLVTAGETPHVLDITELIQAVGRSNMSRRDRQAIVHDLALLLDDANFNLTSTTDAHGKSKETFAHAAAVAALAGTTEVNGRKLGPLNRINCILTGACYNCAAFTPLDTHFTTKDIVNFTRCTRLETPAEAVQALELARQKDLVEATKRTTGLGTVGNCSYHLSCPRGAADLGITPKTIVGESPALTAFRLFESHRLPNATRSAAQRNAIFVLKSARTGSDWLAKLVHASAKVASNVTLRGFFEPFSSVFWFRRCESLQPQILAALVRPIHEENSELVAAAHHLVSNHPNKRRPCESLSEALANISAAEGNRPVSPEEASKTKAVVFLNPRFVDAVTRYDSLFSPGYPGAVLNLRRTNLVKMALSKMQHGLGVVARKVAPEAERVIVDFDLLLSTIHLYCVQDQEWASVVAFRSGRTADVIMLLYEDILKDPQHMIDAVQPWFPAKLVLSYTGHKTHSADLCRDEVINCDELLAAFGNDYRCLAKQLVDVSSATWTLPMWRNPADGTLTIDIKRGDCHPLPDRPATLADRTLADLYVPTGE